MSQLENAPNKPVHLIFISGGFVLFFLLQWTITWLWGKYVATPSEFNVTIIAAIVAFVVAAALYRRPRVYKLADDVSVEVAKVTWPTGQEIKVATRVVIVVTIVMAIILFFMDFAWSKLTDIVYQPRA